MSNLIEQFQMTNDLEFFKKNYPQDEYKFDVVNAICGNERLKKTLKKNNVSFHCGSKTKVHDAFVKYLKSLRQPEEENDPEIGATTGESQDNSPFSEDNLSPFSEDNLSPFSEDNSQKSEDSDLSLEKSPLPTPPDSQNSQRSWFGWVMGEKPPQPPETNTTESREKAEATTPETTVKPGDILRNVNDNDSRIKYEEIMATHKLTDMKHDKLLIKSHEHFLELIPKSIKDNVNIVDRKKNQSVPNKINISCTTTKSVVCNDVNDPDFLKSHLILETTKDGNQEIKILTEETSKIISFAKHIFDLQKDGYQVKLHVCHKNEHGIANINDKIYTYSEIKSIEYEKKSANDPTTVSEPSHDDDDDEEKTEKESGKEKTANEFLDGLNIPSESIFNVDYQYKLWFVLNKGERRHDDVIYLKKARENENDPAGKYSITFPKFREGNGCKIKFLIDEDPNPVMYIPYDERQDDDKNIVDKESPDFFSRFKIQLDPLEHNKIGAFGKFSIKTKITDDSGFMEAVVDKKDNTNKKVRGLIQKYMDKGNYTAAAAEAAKKAGGDDLQILSQRSTSTRKYMVYEPSKKFDSTTQTEFVYKNNKEYFVSHDSPTCVRNLLEGQNLILMTGSGKYAVKFELDSKPEQLSDKVNTLMNLIKENNKFYNLKKYYSDDYGDIIDKEQPIYEYIEDMINKYNDKKGKILELDVYKYEDLLTNLSEKSNKEFEKNFYDYLDKLFNLHIFYEYYEDINYDSNYELNENEKTIFNNWYTGTIEEKELIKSTDEEKSVLKKCKMYLDLQYKMINGLDRLQYINSNDEIDRNRKRSNKKSFLPGGWTIQKAKDMPKRGATIGNTTISEEEYAKLTEIDKIIYQKKDSDVPSFLFKFKILPNDIKEEFSDFLEMNTEKLESLKDGENNIGMLIALTNLILFPKPVNTEDLPNNVPEDLSLDDTSEDNTSEDNTSEDNVKIYEGPKGGGNDISLSYNADSFFLKLIRVIKHLVLFLQMNIS